MMNTIIDYGSKTLKGVCKAKHLKKPVHDDNIYWDEHYRILHTKILSEITSD